MPDTWKNAMLGPRCLPLIFVLTSSLMCGCSRSGIVARGVEPPLPDEQAIQVAEKVTAPNEQAAPEKIAAFRFPEDRGGELMSKLLPPEAAHKPVEPRTEPRRPATSAAIESPILPLPPNPVAMPRLPVAKANTALQPRLVLPEVLGGSTVEPRPPSLPSGELTRVPSVDVNHPIPLPILGLPLSDRAPIEDVTGEASSAAAIAATMPQRAQPAPFVKNNLPDPFEFRRPVGASPAPAEQPTPPAAAPRLPGILPTMK
jgi:hypothetical protein